MSKISLKTVVEHAYSGRTGVVTHLNPSSAFRMAEVTPVRGKVFHVLADELVSAKELRERHLNAKELFTRFGRIP